jgi:hypothetical protein
LFATGMPLLTKFTPFGHPLTGPSGTECVWLFALPMYLGMTSPRKRNKKFVKQIFFHFVRCFKNLITFAPLFEYDFLNFFKTNA